MSEQLELFDGPDGRAEHFAHGAGTLPRRALLPGIGPVQVLGYHQHGYFHVLDGRDERRYVHRDRLQFLRG